MEGRDWDEVGVRRSGIGMRTRLSVAGAVTVVVARAVALSEKPVGAFGLEHAFRNFNCVLEAASGCCTKLWAHDSEPMRGRKAKTAVSSVGVRNEIRCSRFGCLRRRGCNRVELERMF